MISVTITELVRINRATKTVQIWANMENEKGEIEFAWCLRPDSIEFLDNQRLFASVPSAQLADKIFESI